MQLRSSVQKTADSLSESSRSPGSPSTSAVKPQTQLAPYCLNHNLIVSEAQALESAKVNALLQWARKFPSHPSLPELLKERFDLSTGQIDLSDFDCRSKHMKPFHHRAAKSSYVYRREPIVPPHLHLGLPDVLTAFVNMFAANPEEMTQEQIDMHVAQLFGLGLLQDEGILGGFEE